MASKTARKGKSKTRPQKKSKGFFHSTIARLFLVLFIAAAIPLTVMRVQRVQNLEQEAASTPKAGIDCSAQAGSDIIAEPLAPTFGETITFKRANGSFSQEDFEYRIPLGNGVDSNKCTFSDGEIQNCPTKKGTTKDIMVEGKAQRGTTHTIAEDGTPVCQYYVIFKESKPVPTKDTAKPTKPDTPRATIDPKKNCKANLSSGSCTADNKPRLRASWSMKDEGKGCSVKIAGVEVSTKCGDDNEDILNLGGKALENGKVYEIVISNGGSCNGTVPTSAKAPSCSGGSTTNPPGTGTATKFGTPEAVKAKCDASGTQADPKIKVYGYTTPLATSYIVRLRNSEGGTVTKEEKTDKTEIILPVEIDKNYYYSVIAIDKDGKKSSETKSNNDRRIKCTNANFPLAGAPTALDIISDIWDEITH